MGTHNLFLEFSEKNIVTRAEKIKVVKCKNVRLCLQSSSHVNGLENTARPGWLMPISAITKLK